VIAFFFMARRNLSNLAVLKPLPSDIFSLLHLKFDTSIAKGVNWAQLLSTRQRCETGVE
jgi:hypothetical protein